MRKRYILLPPLLILIITLFAACGGGQTQNPNKAPAPPSNAQERVVHVTITDTSIQSSRDNFYVGTPYTFVVTNKGSSPQNFIIRQRVSGPSSAPQPKEGILYIVNATRLKPGDTQTFTYEFPLSTEQTQLQFTTDLVGPHAAENHIPINVRSRGSAMQDRVVDENIL